MGTHPGSEVVSYDGTVPTGNVLDFTTKLHKRLLPNRDLEHDSITPSCDYTKAMSSELLKASLEPQICCCSKPRRKENFCGWGTIISPKYIKSGTSTRKRKSDIFQRLHGQSKEPECTFQHFSDINNYIEEYRHNHSAGDVCRKTPPIKQFPKTCHNNIRNACRTLIGCNDLYTLVTMDTDESSVSSNSTSGSSPNSGESSESYRVRRDINLAPVREYTIVEAPPKQDHMSLNQYLNLNIPKSVLPLKLPQNDFNDRKSVNSERVQKSRKINGASMNSTEMCHIQKSLPLSQIGKITNGNHRLSKQGTCNLHRSMTESDLIRKGKFYESPRALCTGSNVNRDKNITELTLTTYQLRGRNSQTGTTMPSSHHANSNEVIPIKNDYKMVEFQGSMPPDFTGITTVACKTVGEQMSLFYKLKREKTAHPAR